MLRREFFAGILAGIGSLFVGFRQRKRHRVMLWPGKEPQEWALDPPGSNRNSVPHSIGNDYDGTRIDEEMFARYRATGSFLGPNHVWKPDDVAGWIYRTDEDGSVYVRLR